MSYYQRTKVWMDSFFLKFTTKLLHNIKYCLN
jgi:hypothetical protein